MERSEINKIKEEAIVEEGGWTQGHADLMQCAEGCDEVCI